MEGFYYFNISIIIKFKIFVAETHYCLIRILLLLLITLIFFLNLPQKTKNNIGEKKLKQI